ncbi:hypothetical protein KTD31_01975 [Burkholderia multivorans]|uniref:hypothetical protein n=1 Tax=Burkholderia multivorans TaxID=87883 RepID=UPI001C24F1EC|nr:hypothetical protein [Burkholderia multivorans]MBU9200172.1 hypothetical protein [Burkholderia multivorans]MDN8078706.1 hypothetical protein [Burkholderia multivorans]
MSLVIRVPLAVESMNAVAGFYTEGPSLMALFGFISQLELDAKFKVNRFGLVIEDYAARLSAKLTTSMDLAKRGDQSAGKRSEVSYRYADLRAALYLEIEDDLGPDLPYLLEDIEAAINRLRVQGGALAEYVSANPDAPYGLQVATVQDDSDLVAFVSKNENALSILYLSKHLSRELSGEQLVEAYAEELLNRSTLMACHGYFIVGSVFDVSGAARQVGEPSYTLVEAFPVHRLKKLSPAEVSAKLGRFFWSFDAANYAENPHQLFLI